MHACMQETAEDKEKIHLKGDKANSLKDKERQSRENIKRGIDRHQHAETKETETRRDTKGDRSNNNKDCCLLFICLPIQPSP